MSMNFGAATFASRTKAGGRMRDAPASMESDEAFSRTKFGGGEERPSCFALYLQAAHMECHRFDLLGVLLITLHGIRREFEASLP